MKEMGLYYIGILPFHFPVQATRIDLLYSTGDDKRCLNSRKNVFVLHLRKQQSKWELVQLDIAFKLPVLNS